MSKNEKEWKYLELWVKSQLILKDFKAGFVEVLLKASLLLNLGAATVKDLDLGTARSVRSADLSDVVGVCNVKRSER